MPSTKTKAEWGARASAALAVLFCLLVPLLGTAQVVTGPPVKFKIKQPKQKLESFKGDVLNFTNSAITVRDRNNMALVRTFSFTPELTRKVENKRIEGGERVTVRYIKGSDVAVALKGKLRKGSGPFVPVKVQRQNKGR